MSQQGPTDTYSLMLKQREEQRQREEAEARARADQEFFARERAEFRAEQAQASQEGRVVVGRTTTRTETGGTAITESVNRESLGRSNLDVAASERHSAPRDVIDLSPPKASPPVRDIPDPTRGAADFGTATPTRGKPGGFQEVDAFGNVQKGRFDLVEGPKHYNVQIEDRLSGGPYRYEVKLSDTISGRKPSELGSMARPREIAPMAGVGTPTITPPNLQSNRSTKDVFGPGDLTDARYFVDAPLGNLGNTVNAFIKNAPGAKSFGDLSYKMEIERSLFKPKESASGLLVDASYQAIVKNDFKALSKGFAEPIAKNPAILGSVVTDAALFGLPVGRIGSGIRGAGKAIKETSFIKDISASATRTSYSSVIKRADAPIFKAKVAEPNLSAFKKTTVSLGRGEVQVSPLITERRVFENTTVNLGKGSAKETARNPFKNETINLGTSRVAGLGDISSKTFKPRQIKPEDFGAKETIGSDGLIQIVKQETKQQAKQATETSQFQNVSINLGRGAIQGVKADSQTDSVTKTLLGIRATSEQTSRQRRQAGSITSEFAEIGFRTKDTQDFLRSLQQSGLFKSKSEQAQSFKTETGQAFKFDFTPFQITSQKSSQLFKQESKQEFKIDFGISPMQNTKIDFNIKSPPPSRPPGITTEPPTRIPKLFDLDFGEPKKKKQKKRRDSRSKKSEVKLGNPITAILGRDSKAGRRAARFLDKLDFDY